MARKSGLGPLGVAAVEQAGIELLRQPVASPQRDFSVTVGNPAATTVEDPDEATSEPTEWWDFDSSRVCQASYDRTTKRLNVTFQRPSPGQVEYVYEGVEQNEWRNFRRSGSPGRFVDRVLNGKNYHRIR